METKDNIKISYLREQANKRNMNHLKSVQHEALKEANRMVNIEFLSDNETEKLLQRLFNHIVQFKRFTNDFNSFDVIELNNVLILTIQGFKKTEQEKRNQTYHDRLLIEEALRKTAQAQSMLTYNKQMKKQTNRESKGQKEVSLNQAVKENNSLTVKNKFYSSF